MNTIAEILRQSAQQLQLVSSTAYLDCEVLLAHVLIKARSWLYAHAENQLTEAQYQHFLALLKRRQQGEPIAYLIGYKEFFGLMLKVTTATLIPRPETELLVEQALIHADYDSALALDLGTGSGAVALAFASQRPDWQVIAIDQQFAALAVAQENQRKHQLSNVEWLLSDWFAALPASRQFRLVMANPPYIDRHDPHLQQGDVRFEPLSALVADEQGLVALNQIITQAPLYLTPQGWLLVEHGSQQAIAVRLFFQQAGFQQIKSIADLSHQPRITMGQIDQ